MKIIYGLTNFKPLKAKPVVALGVFDGLHCGHQRIISRLIKQANRLKTKSLIVTFAPHPQKEKAIYSLSHRLKILKATGIDLCLVIRFTPTFQKITAEKFLRDILIKKINPRVVFVGRNFTFGKNAGGNVSMLERYSQKVKFDLRLVDVLRYKGRPVSSSYIRNLINSGKLLRAKQLLGRPVTICGKVGGGLRLARRLGYPTANIIPEHEIIPAFGVYGVKVIIAKKVFCGICYIGNRPTLNLSKTSIEVYIYNFKHNLYGRSVEVEFIKKIRSQKRFNSIQELAQQIKKDILCYHNKFHSYQNTPQ